MDNEGVTKIVERLAALEATVQHLTDTDKRFQRHIEKLYGKLDQINYTLFGLLVAVVVNVIVEYVRH